MVCLYGNWHKVLGNSTRWGEGSCEVAKTDRINKAQDNEGECSILPALNPVSLRIAASNCDRQINPNYLMLLYILVCIFFLILMILILNCGLDAQETLLSLLKTNVIHSVMHSVHNSLMNRKFKRTEFKIELRPWSKVCCELVLINLMYLFGLKTLLLLAKKICYRSPDLSRLILCFQSNYKQLWKKITTGGGMLEILPFEVKPML